MALVILATTTPGPPGGGLAELSQFADRRSLILRSLVYDATLVQDPSFFILKAGVTGLNLPPVLTAPQQAVGLDGAWNRETRIGSREVFLPLWFGGASQDDYLAALGNLHAMLLPMPVQTGPALELLASAGDGSTRSLALTYREGAEGEENLETSGAYWATYGLSLDAFDPWWRGQSELVTFGLAADNTPFLSRSASNRWPRKLTTSTVIGNDMALAVSGEVPVWPTYTITGPANSVALSFGATVLSIGAVATGEQLVLTTDPRSGRSLRDASGTSVWDRVSGGARFGSVNPGPNTFSVAIPGAVAGQTSLRASWTPGYRAAWGSATAPRRLDAVTGG